MTKMAPQPDRKSMTTDREERLGEAVEQYLSLAEQGTAPDPEEFAAGFPELGEDLAAALEGLALVQGLVGASPDGTRHRLRAGHRVAGYRIVRELGRGGMGIVYEAVHVDLDRPVALKVLGAPASPGSRGRQRFLNEAKTAAGLHHTHIVPVFDVGQVGGLYYYAMQRIEGCGLDRVLRLLRRERTTGAGSVSGRRSMTPTLAAPGEAESAGSMLWTGSGGVGEGGEGEAGVHWPGHRGSEQRYDPPAFTPPVGSEYYRWVARAGQQAAEALAYAHRRGVIHRDVKPSNLLVDAKGTVWVADFGLARRLADPALTRSDAVVGTPRYMSPEQAEGLAVDGRTDVYSLGATLYELLTLRPPFEGQSAPELIRQITGREAPAPRQFDRRVPRDLETIVLKAMAKRGVDRYATAEEMAEDLGRFLATEPVRARRITPLGRFWRFARRHPAVSGVTAAATVVVMTVAAVAYHRVADERDRALALQGQLAMALAKEREVALERDKAHAKELLSGAARERASGRPKMREAGFSLLSRAAKLDASPELLTRLRDEALEFIALRDVLPHENPMRTGRTRGLAIRKTGSGPPLAVLSEDGQEVVLWDPATGTSKGPLRLEPKMEAGEGEAGEEGAGRGNRGGPVLGPQIAAVGPLLMVVPRDGTGLKWLDPVTGQVSKVELGGPVPRMILASGDGRRLVTARESPVGVAGPNPTGSVGGVPRGFVIRVQLWDTGDLSRPLETLSQVELEPGGRGPAGQTFPRIAVDPEGKTVAIGWWGRSEVGVWDLDSAKKVATVDTRQSVTALALGPEGLLASAGDGKVMLWEISEEGGVPLPGLSEQHGQTLGMRFSPDGALLALVGQNTGVEIWHPSSNAQVASIPTPDRVLEIAFHGRNQLLIASGGEIQAWEVVEPLGRTRFPLEEPAIPLGLVFTRGGRLVVPTAAGDAPVWTPGNCPTRLHTWPEARDADLARASRGRLAQLARDGLVWYEDVFGDPIAMQPWPGESGGGVLAGASERPSSGPPRLLARSADGKHLAMIRFVDRGQRFRAMGRGEGQDEPARRREVGRRDGPAPEGPPPGGPPPGGPLAGGGGTGPGRPEGPRGGALRGEGFRGEPTQLLIWSDDGGEDGSPPALARVVGVPDEGELSRLGLILRYRTPQAAALDPTGRSLYFLGIDGMVRRWTLEGDEMVDDPMPADLGQATCLALRPDGKVLALGRESGEVSLVDVESGQPLVAVNSGDARGEASGSGGSNARRENPERVNAIAFSPDGSLLAVGNAQGVLSVWGKPGGESRRLFDLPGRRASIIHLTFDPSGGYLGASDFQFGEDRSVEVWDLGTIRATLEPLGLGW